MHIWAAAEIAVLRVEELHIAYGEVRALQGVSLSIEQNTITALLGSNGAGKSTLLLAIIGVLRTTSGRIRFNDRDIQDLRAHQIVKQGIVLVPEGRELFPEMSVLENLAVGAYARIAKKQVSLNVEKVFSYFPLLASRRNQRAGTLSGGEQQMLAIGRALMAQPRLLLLDEPSLGLAPMMIDTIFEIIGRINREEGLTILLVEQNTSVALATSSTAYVLETGRVVLAGPSQKLIKNDLVRASYLGLDKS